MNPENSHSPIATLPLVDITKHALYLYAKDRNGKFLEVNNSLAKSFGFDKAEKIIGLSDFDLRFLPFNEASTLRNNDMEIICQDKSHVFMETITLADKTKVTVISHKMPLYSRTNKILGISGVSLIVDKMLPSASLS